MNRRKSVWAGLVVIALVAAAFAADHFLRTRRAAPQFADLDTALAPEKAQGWKVEIPPKQEGPYRRLPGGPVPAGDEMVCRLTNAQGVVVEEVKLQKIEGYDQAIVYLETADGKKTMAVLKHAR